MQKVLCTTCCLRIIAHPIPSGYQALIAFASNIRGGWEQIVEAVGQPERLQDRNVVCLVRGQLNIGIWMFNETRGSSQLPPFIRCHRPRLGLSELICRQSNSQRVVK